MCFIVFIKLNSSNSKTFFKFKLHISVRSFFIRTFHEVAKHVKFSENVKKIVQELYGVINYGELYRKLGVVSDKTLMKLNELIYRGETCVRTKGTHNLVYSVTSFKLNGSQVKMLGSKLQCAKLLSNLTNWMISMRKSNCPTGLQWNWGLKIWPHFWPFNVSLKIRGLKPPYLYKRG